MPRNLFMLGVIAIVTAIGFYPRFEDEDSVMYKLSVFRLQVDNLNMSDDMRLESTRLLNGARKSLFKTTGLMRIYTPNDDGFRLLNEVQQHLQFIDGYVNLDSVQIADGEAPPNPVTEAVIKGSQQRFQKH